MNSDRLTEDQRTILMQHKDRKTTERYVKLVRQIRPTAANVFVPAFGVAQA